jgi:hypothetical protein
MAKVANAVFDCFSLPLFGRQKAAQKPTRGQKRLKDAFFAKRDHSPPVAA